MAAMRAAARSTSSGAVIPSNQHSSTFVLLSRPTTKLRMASFGLWSRRRTSEVLVRSASTKESFGPFRSGSSSGLSTPRFSSVATGMSSSSPSSASAQLPSVSAVAACSSVSGNEASDAHTPPDRTASTGLPSNGRRVSGRIT